MAEKLKIIPLGGLNEIGKNMTAYEYGGEIIVVDCGMAFPGDDMYGIDCVIPDVTYLIKNRSRLRGLFITHGHEDHIGAIPYVLKQVNMPIYCTRFTAGLIKLKLQEHRLLDSTKLVTVNVAAWGYTGIEAGEKLRQAGVAVELTDADNVLFLVTYSDGGADYDAVLAVIQQVFTELEKNKKTPRRLTVSPQLPAPQQVMSLRQGFDSAKTSIPLCRAAGKICAEQVSFYPPGIPVLLPGELITEAIIAYCENMKNLNLPVSGPADGSLREIRVVF